MLNKSGVSYFDKAKHFRSKEVIDPINQRMSWVPGPGSHNMEHTLASQSKMDVSNKTSFGGASVLSTAKN
jgi:hypothetical protein